MFANLRHINKEVKNNQLEGFNTVLEISNLIYKLPITMWKNVKREIKVVKCWWIMCCIIINVSNFAVGKLNERV